MTALARTPKGGSVNIIRGGSEESATIDVFSILGTLWRRKWLIILVTCLGAIAGWFYGKRQEPLYTAEAAVVIEPRESNVVNIEEVLSQLYVDEAAVATERALILSPTKLARVMEDLDLYADPEFNPFLETEEDAGIDLSPGALIDGALALLPNEWLIATGLAEEVDPLDLEPDPRLERDVALSIFRNRLDVTNDGISYVIRINFTSEEARKAALIANRISEIYVEDQVRSKLFATDRASSFLEERLEGMRRELLEAEAAVEDFRSQNNLIATDGVTLNDQELSSLNRELIVARADLAERQARLDLVGDLRNGGGGGLDAITEVVSSPVIVNLRGQEIDILRQEAEMSAQFGPRHPQMEQLRRDKAQLAAKVQAEVDRLAESFSNDVRVAQTRVAAIENQLGSIKGRNVENRSAEVRMRELEREAETSRELYQNFLQRFKETREQQELVEPDARIVAIASPPVRPSTPSPKLFLLVGFAAAFGAGSALALLLDRFDRGIRSAREIESMLGLTTLGIVPRIDRLKRNQKPYQYLIDKPLSGYTEAVRSIYMAIRLATVDRSTKLVLVTSSLPEEGKTTLAVSLAVFVARSHKRVLLVDLDLRHPSIARELGWHISNGIVEYMAGDRELDEVIQHDVETGVDFLAAKAPTTNPTDLLDSQRMRDLLETCRERYDLVVVDSPPLASVTDARVLAIMADKVVFAIQWAKTVASAAQDSIQALRDIDANIAGAVLTQVDLAKHKKYGYGDVGQYYDKSRKYYVN